MKRSRRSGAARATALAACLTFAPIGAGAAGAGLHLDAWLGTVALDFDYTEFDAAGNRLDWERGSLPGLDAGLRLVRGPWFAETALRVHSGSVDYATPAVISATDTDILDASAMGGREVYARADNRLGVYAGLGYRRWRRDIHSLPGASDGLDETYRWWYGSLGLRGDHAVNDRVRLCADLQWRRTLDPVVKVRYAAGFDDSRLEPGAADGLRAAVTLEGRLDSGPVLYLSPWYEYIELGRSADAVRTRNGVPVPPSIYEPRSETHNFGFTAGIRWRVF